MIALDIRTVLGSTDSGVLLVLHFQDPFFPVEKPTQEILSEKNNNTENSVFSPLFAALYQIMQFYLA